MPSPLPARPRRISGSLASRSPLTSECSLLRFFTPPPRSAFSTNADRWIFSCPQFLSHTTSGVEDLSWPPGEILLSVRYRPTLRSPWLYEFDRGFAVGVRPCYFSLFGESLLPSYSVVYSQRVVLLIHPSLQVHIGCPDNSRILHVLERTTAFR